ncbi:NAD-binding protein [Rubrivirga sp. S365]|uniref:NAD-binding protein n=1 Tax=Rubrivirga litoralis TaxID=3075598 RepID=A0ABU3BRC0_9BACT|nr:MULTISPECIES: NAD-binding protein [unclassified Rubrivirga]MDT0631837.1 NAD-binding protein [Rubrivirga sp. F394]MDT7856471.1 NAD-binding protein [Rubrivirga sp. S365]
MKTVGAHLSYFLRDTSVRRNVRSLMKVVAFVAAVVVVFAITFHFVMLHEGEEHSWVTGFYWTLTVMSTLGFGDITFESDLGRLFSILVLVSGILLLLIVLPFAFIRFFYAPWLESQVQMRAPRRVPPGLAGHVVICAYDSITPGLIRRLEGEGVPYVVLEEDPTTAAELYLDGVSVVAGGVDSRATYEALALDRARLVLANREDTVNTNIILTVREVAPDEPVVAIASAQESVDVLELSGATHVLPLKQWLGEQLASRVNALHARSHPIGHYEDLLVAELPVHRTPLANRTVRETRLREVSGVSIVGVWERGHLHPARPETPLTDASVLAVIGTEAQFEALDDLLVIYSVNPNPVVVIGGGRVGAAAVRSLRRRGVPVNLVEREPELCARLAPECGRVVAGDAADYDRLCEAGILEAPSVLLTTNDDAMNIYLASYCRKLNPDLRIVSRITYDRNLESIHRAGADFVLSYATLGTRAVLSVLKGRELVVLGEDVDLFSVPVPRSLRGKTLAQTEIGARTGLSVIALHHGDEAATDLSADTVLAPGAELLMLGGEAQRAEFAEVFGDA